MLLAEEGENAEGHVYVVMYYVYVYNLYLLLVCILIYYIFILLYIYDSASHLTMRIVSSSLSFYHNCFAAYLLYYLSLKEVDISF